ncbi:MAG: glycosyltransferase, partial [Acidobacteriota bacterium]
KAIHLTELPPGWLGKPHALIAAYEKSTGEWLVFTDADVRFAPDLLRRAVTLAHSQGWDHLTILPFVELRGFWEKAAMTYWWGVLTAGLKPWRARDPKSKDYVGVGAFQLLRRRTYEAIGTHRRLALEVVEDVKLGKLVKLGGFASGATLSQGRLRIRWVDGLGEYVRNLTKNMFAACRFSISYVLLAVILTLTFTLLPLGGLFFTSGTPRFLAAVGFLAAAVSHMTTGVRLSRVSPFYAFTFPLGAAIFSYVLLRSTVATLWQGGIVWRETFYPLEELRKGMV